MLKAHQEAIALNEDGRREREATVTCKVMAPCGLSPPEMVIGTCVVVVLPVHVGGSVTPERVPTASTGIWSQLTINGSGSGSGDGTSSKRLICQGPNSRATLRNRGGTDGTVSS